MKTHNINNKVSVYLTLKALQLDSITVLNRRINKQIIKTINN